MLNYYTTYLAETLPTRVEFFASPRRDENVTANSLLSAR